MYEPDALYVAEEGDCVYDSREDYRQIKAGEVFLVHSCGEWVIGRREQIEMLIADLQKVLARLV